MKEEKKVINNNQINNPTQINIGQSENSVQTVGKTLDNILIDNFLDKAIVEIGKGIKVLIQSACFPIIVFILLFPTLWAIMFRQNIIYAYKLWFDGSPGSITWLFVYALPILFNKAFGLIVGEIAILLLAYWVAKRFLINIRKKN